MIKNAESTGRGDPGFDVLKWTQDAWLGRSGKHKV